MVVIPRSGWLEVDTMLRVEGPRYLGRFPVNPCSIFDVLRPIVFALCATQIPANFVGSRRQNLFLEVAESFVPLFKLLLSLFIWAGERAIIRFPQVIVPNLLGQIMLVNRGPARHLANLLAVVEHLSLIDDARPLRELVDQ